MIAIKYKIVHLVVMLFSSSLDTELSEETYHIFHTSFTNHISKTFLINAF
jgi:hypothetical protein